jgi:hypothetical protein
MNEILLIIGLSLVIIGVLQFLWVMNYLDKNILDWPSILLKPFIRKLISILWILLLMIGLYFIWQVHQNIVLILIAVFIILAIYKSLANSLKTKAKTIINLYKGVRKAHPLTNENELLEYTARKFLEKQGYKESRINSIIKSISEDLFSMLKVNDIENLTIYLLYHAQPSKEITSKIDAKIQKAVLQAIKLM